MIKAMEQVGLGSIFTTIGIKVAAAAEVVELNNSWAIADWGMPNWALLISMVGGITFIASNLFNMYLAYKKNKRK